MQYRVQNGADTAFATHIGRVNPFRYRGYYYDEETNLYYLQSRYYDPEIRRFINADDITYITPEDLNGCNLYAYCGNNSVNRWDPTGHFWDTIFDIFFIVWKYITYVQIMVGKIGKIGSL